MQPGHGEGPRRLENRSGVLEDIANRRADLVVGHSHDAVDGPLRDRERERADAANRDAVGKDADAIELDPPSCLERLMHRIGFEGFDADHGDLGPQRLDVAGDAGDQAATANRNEHRREVSQIDGAATRDRSCPVRQ